MNSTTGFPRLVISTGLLFFWLSGYANECPVRVGEYSGTVKAEWLTKTREMRLLEAFAFKGPDCKVWSVPKDAVVDGASIPQLFWTLIGGPFEGRYRDASVVHDYYCKVKTEPSKDVHEMFYYAMLANGVDSNKASLMFYAVSWFGPQWQLYQKAPSARNIYAIGMDTDIRSISTPEIKPTRELVRAMSTTAGQPSPLLTDAIFSGSFNDRLKTPVTPHNGAWLFKEGMNIDTSVFTKSDGNAYFKAIKTQVDDIKASDVNKQFRLLTYGPPRQPTKEEVDRLTSWIEREKPSIADLQKTSIDDIPR